MRRNRKTRAGNAHAAKSKAHRVTPKPAAPKASPPRGRVVTLNITPERHLERASRKFITEPTDRCGKCGSTFIAREPAFIHCHYCGSMARIANAPLGAQELFELRLGLRLAS
jgi:ribosomal protein S27AE